MEEVGGTRTIRKTKSSYNWSHRKREQKESKKATKYS